MKIGEFKEPIDVIRNVTTPDGGGGTFAAAPQVVFQCFAKVTPIDGTRKITAGEQVIEDGIIVQIRRNIEHSLDKSYRIVWRGDTYQIQSIIEKDADKWVWKIIAKRQGDGFYTVIGTGNEDEVIGDENNNAIKVN